MQIKSEKIELIDIDSVIPNPKNANRHSIEQLERLQKLIKYQGFRNPLIISKRTGFLVVGHGRLDAAKALGMKKVPVIKQDFESEAQEYAYLISDNEIARWAELDLHSVYTELETLDLPEIDLLGIDDFSLPEVETLDPQCDEDEVPEIQENPVTKRGDVWLLGKHKLMCGDSTMIDDVEKLMNGEKADITFTSPPYNAAKNAQLNDSNVKGFENKYKNHTDDLDDYVGLIYDSTMLAIQKSKYAFINLQLLANNKHDLIEYQYKLNDYLKDILIWNKQIAPPNITKGAFNTKFEFIYCFSEDNKTRGFPCNWRGKYFNVVDTESNSSNKFADDHKAGFPVSFPSWIIEKMDFCKSVYDPFCGTGTTIISCEILNRKCYGMEIDEKYCDIIINRWQKYTGHKATLESNNKTYNELKDAQDV